MYPAPFQYLTPKSLEEAVDALTRYGDEAKVLAGGQSLVPMMHLHLLAPAYLVDINQIDLGEMRVENGAVVVPALTRQRVFEYGELVRSRCPLVAEAAPHIGNVRVRARGTIGGNLAHADPSSELGCSALAMKAEVRVAGPSGERALPLSDLFVTYLTTCLEPAELITEVRIPTIGQRTGWAFVEMARRAGEFAIVNAAVTVTLDRREKCSSVSVVLGGVGDRVLEISSHAADVLGNEEPHERLFEEVGERAAAVADPRDDVHASADYRREMIGVYTRRALVRAAARAREKVS